MYRVRGDQLGVDQGERVIGLGGELTICGESWLAARWPGEGMFSVEEGVLEE